MSQFEKCEFWMKLGCNFAGMAKTARPKDINKLAKSIVDQATKEKKIPKKVSSKKSKKKQ